MGREQQPHDHEQDQHPEGKVHEARAVDHDGQHDLGELDLLDQLALAGHGRDRVGHRPGEPLEGDHGGKQEDGEVLLVAREHDGHHEHVDQQGDERVKDPPHVAQHRVGALLLDLGADEVADEAAARHDLAHSRGQQLDGTGSARAAAERRGRV